MDSSNTAFRSVEQWKAAMTTLPDAHFFDLMRSVLGNIQSPFNKQRLIDDLSAFLSNKDIQKTISAYIDLDDHKIIAAIAALNEPCLSDLAVFFNGEYSYAELDPLVINLEERLIVYAVREGARNRLSLNPLLKKILLPFVSDNAVLFPCLMKCSAPDSGQSFFSVFNDTFLAAFLTFIAPEIHILKNDGTVRKNLLQKIQKIFPLGADVFVAALRHIGILTEGLFNYTGQKLQDFADLTEAERFAYCAAGVYISISGGGALPPQKNLVRHIAAAAGALFDMLDADNCYPVSTLRRIIMAILTSPADGKTGGAAAVSETLNSDFLFEALEKTNLLLKVRGGYRKRIITHGGDGVIPVGNNAAVIAFNSVFSFILLPEISFRDALSLAPFCEVAEAKPSVQFRITRESAARGFNNGVSGKNMFEILMRLSSGRIDAGLGAAIDDWQKRHSEVVIMEGISVVLSEERRYIARTEPLASHIVFSPMPGVYLLDITEKEDAAEILKNAGIDIISEPRVNANHGAVFQKIKSAFFNSIAPQKTVLTKKFNGQISAPRAAAETAQEDSYRYAEKYKDDFRAFLDGLNYSQMEHEELAARIERRLIISRRQLSGAFIRYEKREAHGLDYAGKLALVKQSILSNEALEVIVQDLNGAEKYIRGVPLTLEKSEGELTLSLKLPEGDDSEFEGYSESGGLVKISMGKIRIIRRIKQSIFSNYR
ncbi:MAG: hypothetical protein LBP37_05400 [Spirochaetaceae bacterium]|jgi:hypothetical protein|nr:hypothetical protein [Spirochaetaceae bacterium]